MSIFFAPKIGYNLSSARISRLFFGFCSLCFLMCAQIFFVTSVRGSGAVPTILARCSEGCTGFINALFFFAVAFAIYASKLSLPPQSLTCGIVTDQVADVRKRYGLSESRLLFWGAAERLGEFRKPKTMSPSGLTVLSLLCCCPHVRIVPDGYYR